MLSRLFVFEKAASAHQRQELSLSPSGESCLLPPQAGLTVSAGEQDLDRRNEKHCSDFAVWKWDVEVSVLYRSTKDVSNSLEASRELQQILSQAQQSNRSSIFGCSPPVRADNPVIHDSTFGTGSATEQCCGAFCSAYNQFIGFDSSPASALSTA